MHRNKLTAPIRKIVISRLNANLKKDINSFISLKTPILY
jgi:hypothetical protein